MIWAGHNCYTSCCVVQLKLLVFLKCYLKYNCVYLTFSYSVCKSHKERLELELNYFSTGHYEPLLSKGDPYDQICQNKIMEP